MKLRKKINDHTKYITIQKFSSRKFAARLKEDNLVTKTNFDNKLISFNRKITSNKTKYLEVQKKLNGLITKDYSFFLGRIYFTSNDGSQNTFVYQLTLGTLELKIYKGADYVLSWKSNGVYSSKLKPLYTAFLYSIKRSGYKIGMKNYKDSLAAEQNNYLPKTVNVYIVYDLEAWPKISLRNFTLKIACLERLI